MTVRVTDKNFGKEVLESDIPVLVDFWAGWCMPCQMIAPAVEAIAVEYEGRLKVCKLNIDEAADTASHYDVMGIPTLLIFRNGEIEDKIVGMMPKNEIRKKIETLL